MPSGRNHSKDTQNQHQHCHKDVRQQRQYHIISPDNPDPAETPSRETQRKPSTSRQLPALSAAEDSTLADNEALTYYPAYCHKSSPTWFEWVKLTACDIHTKLHIKDGYQHSWLFEYRYARDAPRLMFYLNHPVQFVQVVGIVVSFDEYFDRFWLFTIDDSSGLTIDVVCRKPAKEKLEVRKSDVTALNHKDEVEDGEEKEIIQLSNLVASTVEIGSVLQVKGVVTLFRRNKAANGFTDLKGGTTSDQTADEAPIRQISLQRLVKLHDTNQEINLIAARTQFYKSVLSRPWVLSHKEQRILHKEALGEAEHDKKRAKKLVLKRQRLIEMEKEDAEVIRTEYAEEEEMREQAADAVRRAGQRLKYRLEGEKMQDAEKTAPKVARALTVVRSGSEARKDRSKKSHKRRKEDKLTVRGSPVVEQPDTTNDSFAALDDEKSALLRIAFG